MEKNIRAIFDNGKEVVELMISEEDKKYLSDMIKQLNNTVEYREVNSCTNGNAILVRISDSADIPFIEIACRIKLSDVMTVKEVILNKSKPYIGDYN